jgi:hypothetical protein
MVEIKKPDFENMSDNKKYFIIWLVVLFIIIIFFSIYVSISWKNNKKIYKKVEKWDFVIWTVWEWSNFAEFINDYKSKNKNLASLSIQTINFPDYESYYYALNTAFIKWQAPDIFVINNNEKAIIFEDKIIWFAPSEISPSDFRKNFPTFFAKDLIKEYDNNWKKTEFVIWIPLHYETLWIIYNSDLLREIDWNVNEKILSWSWINEIIESLELNNSQIIPIWLWNEKVYFAWDIIANFLIQSWSYYFWWNKVSQTIANFIEYWKTKKSFIKANKTDIELFKNSKLAMIIWYPRILKKLSWMSDSDYVKASYFPQNWSRNNLVNYNYFVINSDSKKYWLAKEILYYFASEKWVKKYYEMTKNYYYFPALLWVQSEIKNELVINSFDIYLKDFENKKYNLVSFDKKLKFFYDSQIKKVLSNSIYNYQIKSQNFERKLNCLAKKIIYLQNLEQNCEIEK